MQLIRLVFGDFSYSQ